MRLHLRFTSTKRCALQLKQSEGWMTGNVFYKFIENIFIECFKDKEALLLSNLYLEIYKSHLMMSLRMCSVVELVPNHSYAGFAD